MVVVGNKQNLGPPYDSNTARENGKKGVVKTNAIRRNKKAMATVCAEFLALRAVQSADGIEKLKNLGINPKQFDMQASAVLKQIEKATKGDLQALIFLRDTAGEKPVDKVDMTQTVSGDFVLQIGGDDDAADPAG